MKSYLLVKSNHLEEAKSVFGDHQINITNEGRNYLRSPIGTSDYVEDSCRSKVAEWIGEIKILSEIVKSQPQAALSLLMKGVASKWLHLLRTVDDVAHLLQPLEQAIRQKLLPYITGRSQLSNQECRLFALPPGMEDLEYRTLQLQLVNPTETRATSPLH